MRVAASFGSQKNALNIWVVVPDPPLNGAAPRWQVTFVLSTATPENCFGQRSSAFQHPTTIDEGNTKSDSPASIRPPHAAVGLGVTSRHDLCFQPQMTEIDGRFGRSRHEQSLRYSYIDVRNAAGRELNGAPSGRTKDTNNGRVFSAGDVLEELRHHCSGGFRISAARPAQPTSFEKGSNEANGRKLAN